MKKPRLSVGCFALVFALALAGCGDGAGGPDGETETSPIPETDAPVYTWQNYGGGMYKGVDLDVKIEVFDGTNFDYLDAGTIRGGKLTLNLPDLDNPKYSGPLKAGHFDKEGVTVSPEDAAYHIADFYVFEGETEKGSLGYFKETGSNEAAGDEIIYYYLDKPATVTGGYYVDWDETTYSYSITAKAGWNRIWKHPSPADTTETETETTDLTEMPDGMEWIVDVYE
jgi:hypothetical protein